MYCRMCDDGETQNDTQSKQIMFNLIDYIEDKRQIFRLFFGRVHCMLYNDWGWMSNIVGVKMMTWMRHFIFGFVFGNYNFHVYLIQGKICIYASAVYLLSQGMCNVSSLHCAHWLKQCNILAITHLMILIYFFACSSVFVHRTPKL